MSTLMEELTAIKAVEDKLTANKVANFAYTDHAYNNPLTEADGVASYDPDAEQNIPNANASTLQVNSTVLTKGWRAQASAITRMLMNHFLGRCSYNLNKINDLFSLLLGKLMAYMGVANGLATLDENGYVPTAQLSLSKEDVDLGNVVNTGDSAVPAEDGTDKFTTGGAYTLNQTLSQLISERAPKNHTSSSSEYGEATSALFGHVKKNIGSIRTTSLSYTQAVAQTVDLSSAPIHLISVELTTSVGSACPLYLNAGGYRYSILNFVCFYQSDGRPTRELVDEYSFTGQQSLILANFSTNGASTTNIIIAFRGNEQLNTVQ